MPTAATGCSQSHVSQLFHSSACSYVKSALPINFHQIESIPHGSPCTNENDETSLQKICCKMIQSWSPRLSSRQQHQSQGRSWNDSNEAIPEPGWRWIGMDSLYLYLKFDPQPALDLRFKFLPKSVKSKSHKSQNYPNIRSNEHHSEASWGAAIPNSAQMGAIPGFYGIVAPRTHSGSDIFPKWCLRQWVPKKRPINHLHMITASIDSMVSWGIDR